MIPSLPPRPPNPLRRGRDGLEVLELMRTQGIRPDIFTFGSLMSLCAVLARDGLASLEDGYKLLR